jgi:predicted aspartyl protease
MLPTTPDRLTLTWTRGNDATRLDVDLSAMTASITASGTGGTAAAWHTIQAQV